MSLLFPFTRAALGLGALAVFCVGCPEFKKPTASVERADIAVVDFGSTVVDVTVTVDNPNGIPLMADRLSYQGFIEGHPLANGELKQHVVVPAHGKATVRLPVRFNYKELGDVLQSMRDKKQWAWKVTGELGLEPHESLVIALPFVKDGTLPAPTMPTVTAKNGRLESATMSGATVLVDIVIKNDNAFALPAATIAGDLSLSGKKTPIRLSVPSVSANKSATVTVRQAISLSSVAGAGLALMTGQSVAVVLDAAVVVADQRQPVSASFTLKR